MSTIITRAGKGSPLTNNEMDANLNNLNNDKLEATAIGVSIQAHSVNLDEFASVNPTAAGLAILDDADAAAQRVTLGAQATLVSGTNIKTINGNSVLGSGDLSITISDGDKGDITVSGSGTTLTIDSGVVTPAKLTQPITSGTAQATTSGTSKDFTGIPSWVKRITVNLSGVSTNGTSIPLLQLGTSGGVETTGYTGGTSGFTVSAVASINNTSGAALTNAMSAGITLSGRLTIELLDTNQYTISGNLGRIDAAGTFLIGYSKTVSSTLDRVRLTTANGTDSFDAGSVNIIYEG